MDDCVHYNYSSSCSDDHSLPFRQTFQMYSSISSNFYCYQNESASSIVTTTNLPYSLSMKRTSSCLFQKMTSLKSFNAFHNRCHKLAKNNVLNCYGSLFFNQTTSKFNPVYSPTDVFGPNPTAIATFQTLTNLFKEKQLEPCLLVT